MVQQRSTDSVPGPFVDISVPLVSGMLNWPGDPPVEISRMRDQAAGDEATVSRLDMGAHTGTHMDAPMHFIDDAPGMETVPLDAVIGKCRVIELEDETRIGRESLARFEPTAGERILLKTRNSRHHWWERPFDENFVYIAAEAARYLASCGVTTIGIDYLSVGGYHHDGVETHRALLEAGIWVIEGLDLTRVQPGDYTLICLPLKLVGGDGAPARAVLAGTGR